MPEDAYLAASLTDEHDIDVGAYRLGMVYGKALLAATEKAGNTDEVLDELDQLIALLVKQPQAEEVFASGMIANDQKVILVERALSGHVTPTFLNFLKVVASHGRGGFLRAIRKAVRDLRDQQHGRVRVQVTTATPLDGELSERIQNQLRNMLGGEPVLATKVDPDLIGGLVFRVGDTVYDGSVATRLARVRSQMIDRSIHEIQRRRDSLSSPTGN
ncbi:MAG TPA: ATP synthase F1 subunit delta [Pirellulales bacterium]|nr:ATP synthase F1 subunit delta [Pirellulales bacterium]